MRQLRRRVHAAVAPRRHGPLPVQRVRPVPQDERHEPAAGQAVQETRQRSQQPLPPARGTPSDQYDIRSAAFLFETRRCVAMSA